MVRRSEIARTLYRLQARPCFIPATPMTSCPRREDGFTLAEVLVSMALLTVGLLGVGAALAVQSGVVTGVTTGQAAVTRGYYGSTATMLAHERLEQVRRLQYTVSVDELSEPTPTGFEDEKFGSIAGLPDFSREVRIQGATPAANSKTVTVTVRYNLPTDNKTITESVILSTIIAARP